MLIGHQYVCLGNGYFSSMRFLAVFALCGVLLPDACLAHDLLQINP